MPSNGLVKLGGAGLAGAPLDRERESERSTDAGFRTSQFYVPPIPNFGKHK